MAEFLFKDMIQKRGLQDDFLINSAATSTEEIRMGKGNPVHRGTKQILNRLGITCEEKRAVQITKADYKIYDYIICMDQNNLNEIVRICGADIENKVYRLLDFTQEKRDVKDPWYTGNFEKTYQDILLGLEGFLTFLDVK